MKTLALAFFLQAPAVPPPSDLLIRILEIRRVYIDRLGGGETAAHLRDMIINEFQRSGLFIITENAERADAILRGSAEDLIFTDVHQSSEGIQARASLGTGSTSTRSTAGRTNASAGIGDREDHRISERKHEAAAAVRLVNKDGDVIWATTQESLGAKFRGASADVANKIVRQLQLDYTRARGMRTARQASEGAHQGPDERQ
jgi:hypothetical protein